MRVSVIVTNYNYSHYIGKALRSLLDQSLRTEDYEIIVLDDNSGDISMKLLEAYLDSIRLIRADEHKGNLALCNEGFRRARGQFVVRVDADDYVNRNFLELESMFLIENKEFDAVSCDYYKVDTQGNRWGRYDASIEPIACGVMFRREMLFYDDDAHIWDDVDCLKHLNVYRIPLPLYRYLQHSESLTHKVVSV